MLICNFKTIGCAENFDVIFTKMTTLNTTLNTTLPRFRPPHHRHSDLLSAEALAKSYAGMTVLLIFLLEIEAAFVLCKGLNLIKRN
jgi:hypothetical protein